MPKNTRLSGHTLRSEGKPFQWSTESRRYVRTNTLYGANTGDGVALCSCGTRSPMLHSNAERKRWHALHKDDVRAQLADSSLNDESYDPEADFAATGTVLCADCGTRVRPRTLESLPEHRCAERQQARADSSQGEES
ncbi:hypothetical protein [Nonomuraea sp. NPDC003804]|uniref:hypothetical protein n=1 Tax=Nonomuraea sp. NPDC003804 TaxID=3154547 RepID=UPI0033AF2DC0